jgi:hypothetical protein
MSTAMKISTKGRLDLGFCVMNTMACLNKDRLRIETEQCFRYEHQREIPYALWMNNLKKRPNVYLWQNAKPMKKIFLLLFIATRTFAQTPPAPTPAAGGDAEYRSKNVVKFNMMSLALATGTLQYERALHKNFSVALAGTRVFERGLNNFLTNGDPFLESLKFDGWAITPEFRFYPGKTLENPAPHGFYIALYGRMTNLRLRNTFFYSVESTSNGVTTNNEYEADASFVYRGTGVGLMFGSQWIVAKHFSIDWWIIGGHYGTATFRGDFKSPSIADYPNEFKTELLNQEGVAGVAPANVKVSGDEGSFKVGGFGFGGIRAGLTLGFAF